MRRRAASTGHDRAWTVSPNDQLTKPAPYNDVVIACRNGAPVRIGDIGQAVRGAQNDQWPRWQNGKRGILLLVFKQPGANVIATVQRVKAALPALEANMPPAHARADHRRSHADHPRLGA